MNIRMRWIRMKHVTENYNAVIAVIDDEDDVNYSPLT